MSMNLVDPIGELMMSRLTTTIEFHEFCSTIDTFDQMWKDENELFIEKAIDPKSKFLKDKGKIVKNTVDTTVGMKRTYDDLTDIGGTVYSGAYKVTMSAVNLASRMLSFLVKWIMKVPDVIVKIINGIANIPQNIMIKIRGDIKLNITAEDLQMLFGQRLIFRLNDYLSQLKLLTEGDMWSTFFHRKLSITVTDPIQTPDGRTMSVPAVELGKNDMEICRSLNRKFTSIKMLTFEETIINLNDKNNVETYFGNENKFTVVSIDGTKHDVTYYGALKLLAEELQIHKGLIEQLSVDLGQKFTETQLNETFAGLKALSRSRVIKTIQEVSKISSIIANLYRYILIDMRTIEDSINRIQKKKNIAVDTDAKAHSSMGNKTKVTGKKKV